MIKDKIISIMKEVFKIDHVPDNISQASCADWDSLKHLSLIVTLEEKFDISFEPEEIERMTSLNAILAMIEVKK